MHLNLSRVVGVTETLDQGFIQGLKGGWETGISPPPPPPPPTQESALWTTINPMQELIVGVTERLSLGSGKEVMPYLKEGSERMLSLGLALAEDGNMGHIVPNHKYILDLVSSSVEHIVPTALATLLWLATWDTLHLAVDY